MSLTVLEHIPLDQLCVSRLNMRHGRKAPDVSDILPSIREKGVHQTLLVRREGESYGVIAGRRRLFALQAIARETGANPLVPCAIMAEGDAASAIEASLIENVARLPATEMEQFAAFRKLHSEGKPVADIAGFFGITELSVRRVLALAGLAAPIRKLYANDEIDRDTVRALTLGSAKQQADWLTLWNSETERAPMGRACKAWITGGAAITTDKALFDLADYSGAVTADLFGDAAVFADAGAFWAAQDAAIARRVEDFRTRGWTDVVLLQRGDFFHRWDHVQTPKKKGGKVVVEQRHDGTVTFHEGWLRASEARKGRAQTAGSAEATARTAKPEMSGPMAEYVGFHWHGAAQASLLTQPRIALCLMAAHAVIGSALWNVRAHACKTRRDETRASVESARAAREMEVARERVSDLFSAHGVNGEIRRNGDPQRLCVVFAALLTMTEDEVSEVVAFTMAETLDAGGPVTESVLQVCGTDLAAYWAPEPVFFELLRDKAAINAMIADIASPALAASCAKETATAQKVILMRRISVDGCEPRPDWRPGWMRVPPARVISGGGSP